MTPVQQAQYVIQRALAIEQTSESAAQKAGHRLALSKEVVVALQRLLSYHMGYRRNSLVISALVSELLKQTFAATNGELRWATELPPGKAPHFRRALVNLINYFKKNPLE